MPGPSKKSRFLQRCVADVTGQGKDLQGAFAICTAQSQRAGYSAPGSSKQTGKGKAREKQFKGAPDMKAKGVAYERAVRAGRKEEIMSDIFDEACATPGRKIRSGGRGRGLAVGDGEGPIGGRGRSGAAAAPAEDALCDDPGKRRRSQGKGRGLGVGRGRGPVGRMRAEGMAAVFAQLAEEDGRPAGRIIGRVAFPGTGRVALFERTERDGSNSYEVAITPGAGATIYVQLVDLRAANKLIDVFHALREDILGVRDGRR